MRRSARRALAIVVTVFAVLVGMSVAYERGLLPGGGPGEIQRAALKAWWRWQSTATVRDRVHAEEAIRSLDHVTMIDSFIIVMPVGESLPMVVRGKHIDTLVTVRLESTLSKRPPKYVTCPDLPPHLQLSEGQLALWLRGGKARILGVGVTFESFYTHTTLKPNAKYLAVGHVCDNGLVLLSPTTHSVFEIDSNGTLLAPGGVESSAGDWPQALLALGTVDAIERHLVSERDGR